MDKTVKTDETEIDEIDEIVEIDEIDVKIRQICYMYLLQFTVFCTAIIE